MKPSNLKTVLYVEDEEDDVFFLQKAWQAEAVPNPLAVVSDGKQAIDYFSTDPSPCANICLVILDLNLPGRSGFDVLKWVRQQTRLCTLPVLILTSSRHDRDVHNAYRLGANAYLLKSPQALDLKAVVREVRDFWLLRNQLPPDPRHFEITRSDAQITT